MADALTPEELQAAEELAKAQRDLSWQLTRAGVDAASIVDPTEITNVASMGMSIYDGDFVGAGLSLVSLIPLAGKLSAAAKEARTVKRLEEVGKLVAGLTAKLGKLQKMRAEAKAAEEIVAAAKITKEAKEAEAAEKLAKEAVLEAKAAPHADPKQRCIPCEKAAAERATAEKAAKATKPSGKYGHLEDPPGVKPGGDFTAAQKKQILAENRKANGGRVKTDAADDHYTRLSKPPKSQRGVTPKQDEWQIDHIVPKNKGGTNSYSNARVISRRLNREKWDN